MVSLDTLSPQRDLIGDIPVEIRRSKRRRTRIGLAFDPGGFVIVEAPLDATDREIRALVREHRRWLRHRLDKVTDGTGLTACLRYTAGELLHYLGHPYELVIRQGRNEGVRLKERRPAPAGQLGLFACHVRGQLCVTLRTDPFTVVPPHHCDPRVRGALGEWYLAEGDELFERELKRWARKLPWLRGRVPLWRHRYMRSQWGSCSRTGRISLNTHLVKTPHRLIEYVVLHELCHLQHYDHSRRFYALMGRYMPDWQQRRAELDHFLPVLLQD